MHPLGRPGGGANSPGRGYHAHDEISRPGATGRDGLKLTSIAAVFFRQINILLSYSCYARAFSLVRQL